ncbi:glycoside hydrolase [Candidatus Nitromaritima sp. SCGC AAA799-C22]|nr:glycoside hydrolase [Candidatus Nitromaritima sp. SCGC AAA799-C22]
MGKFVCIHGHFYQPPRENPWLEAITHQESAHPHHDWNERVTAECYAPNAQSRILDDQGFIVEMINNYSKISFDMGPTLLSWLELNSQDIYQAILEADEESRKLFSGHGSAMAQCYSHMIMPLANSRDKYTQVYWGIRDFEHRFKRLPEGMWLPETAVDLETLKIMAELGIRFIVLAPGQARRFRPLGEESWRETEKEEIDTTRPYALQLPSGKAINVFFYNGELSRALAFENLLVKSEHFARRLLDAVPEENHFPQLIHVATDGETYGHHHKFGDMALAYALKHIEVQSDATLTNYAEFLEKFPPAHEVEIKGDTSWSCAHGVERWRSDCGCHTGGEPDWDQNWRGPLREALDWLRDAVVSPFNEKGLQYLKDPWEARNDYIRVMLDRSLESIDRFLERNTVRALDDSEKTTVLKIMEMQRHAMLMYTSCGWFFCEISGTETVQILQYAARTLELAEEIFGGSLRPRFLKLLEKAKSNLPAKNNGRQIFERDVEDARVNLSKLCAHFALDSLFEEFNHENRIFTHAVELEDFNSFESGRARLAMGRARVTSQVTLESCDFHFGVMHHGDYNLKSFVHALEESKEYQCDADGIESSFKKGNFSEALRQLEEHFGATSLPLKFLSKKEQKRIFDEILNFTLAKNEPLYKKIYDSYAPLHKYLMDEGIPAPKIISTVMEAVLNARLRKEFERHDLRFDKIKSLLEEVELQEASLDCDFLGYVFKGNLERLAQRLFESPHEMPRLVDLENAVKLLPLMPFEVNLWKTQNLCYEIMRSIYPGYKEKKQAGDSVAEEWITRFNELARAISIRTP